MVDFVSVHSIIFIHKKILEKPFFSESEKSDRSVSCELFPACKMLDLGCRVSCIPLVDLVEETRVTSRVIYIVGFRSSSSDILSIQILESRI